MCPKCRSDHVSRSKTWRISDLFMRVWGMWAYRCRECQTRFYLPKNLETKVSAERDWVKPGDKVKTKRRRKKKKT
jgi:hypothetical protein